MVANGVLERRHKALRGKGAILESLLEECRICPRNCGVNRLIDERGYCKAGHNPVIYAYQPHLGEEPPISGHAGSGTIFFSNCNMRCVYCQNFKFSQSGEGEELSIERLADIMLELQGMGCHNINLVTPTHFAPQIIEALGIAVEKGLNIPIVYNTSGYDSVDTLRLFDGIVDIYLPDMRYGDDDVAYKYSSAKEYVNTNRSAVLEMYRQAGGLMCDEHNIAKRGVIIRHLILPNRLAGTDKVLKFIRDELSADMYISLMAQYTPLYKAGSDEAIDRKITMAEYDEAVGLLGSHDLANGWVQEYEDADYESKFLGTNLASIDKEKAH